MRKRSETEFSLALTDIIMSFAGMSLRDKEYLVKAIRFALDEAYGEGALEGTRDTCDLARKKMNLSK